jgi:archaemetzincin
VILLIPVGEVDGAILTNLREPVSEAFGDGCQTTGPIPLPVESWNRWREQYDADIVLRGIPFPPERSRILAVAAVDLFTHGLSFVFGAADATGRRAAISVFRLRQELYYQPRDEALLRKRTLTEAVHELGHTYGLEHCPSSSCVMHFSNTLSETDAKGWKLCRTCLKSFETLAGA